MVEREHDHDEWREAHPEAALAEAISVAIGCILQHEPSEAKRAAADAEVMMDFAGAVSHHGRNPRSRRVLLSVPVVQVAARICSVPRSAGRGVLHGSEARHCGGLGTCGTRRSAQPNSTDHRSQIGRSMDQRMERERLAERLKSYRRGKGTPSGH